MNDSPPLPSRLLRAYAAVAKWSLIVLAAFWLLVAAAWGALNGWILPRIGDWRPELEQHASRAVGVPVRIGQVQARIDGLVPSFELAGVVLHDPRGREALRLERVVVALSPRSLWNRGFDQLYVEGPRLEVRRAADGRLFIAGLDIGRGGPDDGSAADWLFRQSEIVIRGGAVQWTDEMQQAPALELSQVDLVVRNTGRRHAIRLDATPPPPWGDRFTLVGQFRHPFFGRPGRWQDWDGQLHADFARVDLRELRRHTPLGVQVEGGHGALRAWADVTRGRIAGGTADLSVAGVSARLAPHLQPLALASLSGRLAGKRLPNGFELETRALQFTTGDGQRWPGGNVHVGWTEADGKRPAAGELRADRLDLGALRQLAAALPLGAAAHQALARHAPRGQVETLQARWQGPAGAPHKYQARGKVTGLHLAAVPATGLPGVRNAAIDFEFTEGGGKARLALPDGALDLPGVFEDPLVPFDRLSTDLQWQLQGPRISVTAANLKFSNADAQGEAQLTWRTADGEAARRFPGVLDLQGSLSRAKGSRVWRYLPLGVPRETREYVRESVQLGEAGDARFRVRGHLRDFPFLEPRQGEFRISAQVRDATYAFAPARLNPGSAPWPALTQLSGRLVFERGGMRVEDASGRLSTAPNLRVRASAAIADLNNSVVAVTGEVRGPLHEALSVVQRSPVADLVGDGLAQATATGAGEVRLRLSLPVAQIERSRVQGTVTLAGNDVQITPDSPLLARARGAVTFSERGFALAGAQARVYGGDVRIDGGTRPVAADGVVLRVQGQATAEALRQASELGFLARLAQRMTGAAAYSATLTFRGAAPEVSLTSNLQGIGLSLPPPFNKAPEAVLPLRYDNAVVREGPGVKVDQLALEIGRLAAIHYLRDVSGAQARVLRGSLAIGLSGGEAVVLPEQGVAANIVLGSVDVDAWEQVLGAFATAAPPAPRPPEAPRPPAGSSPSLGYLPTTLALRARELTLDGRTLHNLVVGGSREGLLWRGNVDADELNGYVEYRQPAGSGSGRVYARLARLSIAAAAASSVETLLDEQPDGIPALDVVVDDFELRGRKLGRLEIDAVNRGGGAVVREGGVREWRLNRLTLTLPEAVFNATGNWAAADAQPAPPGGPRPPRTPAERRRTAMNFRLDIADAGLLLARFGMRDVVRRGQGSLEGQVGWLGSPLAFDYPTLAGNFHVDISAGQFLKAEPGLAKLLGVLNLQTLPRRLALDFRDVFSQGFSFDFVRGDVVIQQGIAATNNLQMKGVNAAVLMEGRADLARETQDLRVVVVPEINAGTASLVAAAINPAIGLGTFLAQIFLREPLARATTQQFQIDGTWTDPRVTRLPRNEPRPADSAGAETSTTR